MSPPPTPTTTPTMIEVVFLPLAVDGVAAPSALTGKSLHGQHESANIVRVAVEMLETTPRL